MNHPDLCTFITDGHDSSPTIYAHQAPPNSVLPEIATAIIRVIDDLLTSHANPLLVTTVGNAARISGVAYKQYGGLQEVLRAIAASTRAIQLEGEHPRVFVRRLGATVPHTVETRTETAHLQQETSALPVPPNAAPDRKFPPALWNAALYATGTRVSRKTGEVRTDPIGTAEDPAEWLTLAPIPQNTQQAKFEQFVRTYCDPARHSQYEMLLTSGANWFKKFMMDFQTRESPNTVLGLKTIRFQMVKEHLLDWQKKNGLPESILFSAPTPNRNFSPGLPAAYSVPSHTTIPLRAPAPLRGMIQEFVRESLASTTLLPREKSDALRSAALAAKYLV